MTGENPLEDYTAHKPKVPPKPSNSLIEVIISLHKAKSHPGSNPQFMSGQHIYDPMIVEPLVAPTDQPTATSHQCRTML